MAEPIEKADPKDPIEPIESAEPTEPIDRNEPVDPIDRNDPSDHSDIALTGSVAVARRVVRAPRRRRRYRGGRAHSACALSAGPLGRSRPLSSTTANTM